MDSPQATTAPQPRSSTRTIAADGPVLIAPAPFIVAETRASLWSAKDVEIMRKQFHLPADITVRAMTVTERSNRPSYPLVAFNKAIMMHGALLSLYPLVWEVLAHLALSPSQLNPKVYKVLAGMHIL